MRQVYSLSCSSPVSLDMSLSDSSGKPMCTQWRGGGSAVPKTFHARQVASVICDLNQRLEMSVVRHWNWNKWSFSFSCGNRNSISASEDHIVLSFWPDFRKVHILFGCHIASSTAASSSLYHWHMLSASDPNLRRSSRHQSFASIAQMPWWTSMSFSHCGIVGEIQVTQTSSSKLESSRNSLSVVSK